MKDHIYDYMMDCLLKNHIYHVPIFLGCASFYVDSLCVRNHYHNDALPESFNMTVLQPQSLEKKEQHKSSQAHVPTLWSLLPYKALFGHQLQTCLTSTPSPFQGPPYSNFLESPVDWSV